MTCKHATASQLVLPLKTIVEQFMACPSYQAYNKKPAEKTCDDFAQLNLQSSIHGNPNRLGMATDMAKGSKTCTSTSVFTEMKKEVNRLASFKDKWPLPEVKPSDLASVGLFYLNDGDSVQCAFCRGIITEWKIGDDPLKEHIYHFPMCPLLLGKDVDNVPIQGSEGFGKVQSFHEGRSSNSMSKDLAKPCPKYPCFNNVDKRLRTFAKWSPYHTCSPENLAQCGLFYTGTADIVTCFNCGGSLGRWERGDDPWVEHAKHFPECAYLRYIKGSGFVQSVQNSLAQPVYFTESGYACQNASSAPSNATEKVNNRQETLGSQHASGSIREQQKYLCKICMEEKPRVAFIPCGHSLACPNCAKHLSTCPVCRHKIESAVRIYFD